MRIGIGYIAVPTSLVGTASAFVTVVFMVVPILALFLGAAHRWDLAQAVAFVVLGAIVQLGLSTLAGMAVNPVAGGILFALGQMGLVVWCMGVGAGLACLLKDRNMLLPMAAFLALFDMWLVFAPEGMVGKIARGNQETLAKVAYTIPRVADSQAAPETAPHGFAQPLAFVGPADLLFLAMFFVALYRFEMRSKETFRAMMPVLIAYLAAVLIFSHYETSIGPIRLAALPALLPIGLTVLWVNRREFKLLPDERAATIGLLIIGIPLVAWRIAVSQPEPEPAPTVEWAPPFEKQIDDLRKPIRY
ncbi:hypothetical protein EON82_12635 [bacterium]|nr:MAG: hypothetical protein EON82_12635 [bacterium]